MKHIFIIILTFFSIIFSFGQEVSYPNLGTGIQLDFPIGGLSVKYNHNERHTAQAIIGLFGDFSSYSVRYLYNFNEQGNALKYKPYAYGKVGMLSYEYYSFTEHEDMTERDFNFGIGGGVEMHYPDFTERLRYSLEIGYDMADTENYEYNSLVFGIGIHYYFNLSL